MANLSVLCEWCHHAEHRWFRKMESSHDGMNAILDITFVVWKVAGFAGHDEHEEYPQEVTEFVSAFWRMHDAFGLKRPDGAPPASVTAR